MKKCPYCGEEIHDEAIYCRYCQHYLSQNYSKSHTDNSQQWYGASGYRQYAPGDNCYGNSASYNENEQQYYSLNNAFDSCPEGKSRGIAGLLAILLGAFGVHYFYLNKIQAGLITILLSLVTCGIWPWVMLVQGVLMLCMDNATFRQKYVLNQSVMPMF